MSGTDAVYRATRRPVLTPTKRPVLTQRMVLQDNFVLRALDLKANYIGDAGARALATAAQVLWLCCRFWRQCCYLWASAAVYRGSAAAYGCKCSHLWGQR
eukprot:2405433-Rhodomonas_salina.2